MYLQSYIQIWAFEQCQLDTVLLTSSRTDFLCDISGPVNNSEISARSNTCSPIATPMRCLGCRSQIIFSSSLGTTPLFGQYRDVPLDRIWFFDLAILNKVWYYRPRDPDPDPDCKQSLSFLSLWPGTYACKKLKEHAIKRGTSEAFLFLICIVSTE